MADPTDASELDLLIRAAQEGGKVAMKFWRRDPRSWAKADASPVSEGDMAVNTALQASLMAARPVYGWLSEESPDSPARLLAPRTFILDPIDGTRAFLAGEDAFAVSLALVDGLGQVRAGVVHLPAMGLTYAATRGGPALCNGTTLAVSPRGSLAGARVLTKRATLAAEHWPGGVPEVEVKFRASLAWRLCLVAEGRYDAMMTLRPAHEWDIAAGALIAERAGARVTDRHGRGLRFNAPLPVADGTLAAPPALHAALMAGLTGPR